MLTKGDRPAAVTPGGGAGGPMACCHIRPDPAAGEQCLQVLLATGRPPRRGERPGEVIVPDLIPPSSVIRHLIDGRYDQLLKQANSSTRAASLVPSAPPACCGSPVHHGQPPRPPPLPAWPSGSGVTWSRAGWLLVGPARPRGAVPPGRHRWADPAARPAAALFAINQRKLICAQGSIAGEPHRIDPTTGALNSSINGRRKAIPGQPKNRPASGSRLQSEGQTKQHRITISPHPRRLPRQQTSSNAVRRRLATPADPIGIGHGQAQRQTPSAGQAGAQRGRAERELQSRSPLTARRSTSQLNCW